MKNFTRINRAKLKGLKNTLQAVYPNSEINIIDDGGGSFLSIYLNEELYYIELTEKDNTWHCKNMHTSKGIISQLDHKTPMERVVSLLETCVKFCSVQPTS